MPVGVTLIVAVVADTEGMDNATGSDGAPHPVAPLPEQAIYCDAQSVVPDTVTVAVSLATTEGVNWIYTGVAAREVP